MNKKHCLYRFIAKVIVFCMLLQGLPIARLSQIYQLEFQPQRLIKILGYLSTLTLENAHAQPPSENGGYVSIFGPKQYLRTKGKPNVYRGSKPKTEKIPSSL